MKNKNKILFTIKNRSVDNSSKIDYRFKVVYAIAMLSVIAEHCRGKGSLELNIQGWFNYSSYHMPLFMFAAGYFFKEKYVNSPCDYILRKFKKLIMPIYLYNFIYGFYIQFLKTKGFKNNIRPFSFRIIFIEPLSGEGFKPITPSWFSSSLFFFEIYNVLKRKIISILRVNLNESTYFIIDIVLSSMSVTYSNKGYNKKDLYMQLFRFLHLNVYYELGIFYNKFLEKYIYKITSDIYFCIIFIIKLGFYLYYSKELAFHYGKSNYFKNSPHTVIIISFLGIALWLRISEILEPIFGKDKYINLIADNTFSIMINHSLALDIIRTIFSLISKNTRYCKDFNFNRYYGMDARYIYIPKNIVQTGIIYFLSCLVIPIIIQKIINTTKKQINERFLNLKINYSKIGNGELISI